VDVTGESKAPKELQETRVVVADLCEISEVTFPVSEVPYEVECWFKAGHEDERTAARGPTCVKVEGGRAQTSKPPRNVGGVRVIKVGDEPV
jgi:hypothetical protein